MPTKPTVNPRGQSTLSTFFSPSPSPTKTKRVQAPKRTAIDLTTISDEDERPTKKARTHTPRRDPDQEGEVSERWKFAPASPEKPNPASRSPAEEVAIRTRREEFKKRLIGENDPFAVKKPSNDAGVDDDEADDVVEGGGDASDASDSGFQKLISEFEAGSKSKGKAKASKLKGKERPPGRSRSQTKEIGPSGEPYTELELQVRDLKEKYPGTMLIVEVGYKCYFFGDDAKVASKELGIVCYPKGNFLRASIPTQRREIHLKKLLSQGYKVGLVNQTETAALKKAGDTRNKLFSRRLSHIYTATTYVDELDSVDRSTAPPLMCLVEDMKGGMGADDRVALGMIVVSPSTGDVVWDDFDDTHMRTELETRMAHTGPSELLLPETKLSKPTEKMLTHFVHSATTDHRIRIERYDDPMSYTEAYSFISEFYSDKTKVGGSSESFNSGELLAAITDFPKRVVVALAHAIRYLSAATIADAFLETRFFAKFTSRACMLLQGNTLTNLEIYRNETDYTLRGSLMWILDRTRTRFGARMLRSWVGKPLVDRRVLQDRVDAVEEIVASDNVRLVTLRELLKGLPDLAKGLCRIQYGKCTPQELALLLKAFNRISSTFNPVPNASDVGFKSSLLNEIVHSLPKLRAPVKDMLNDVLLNKASAGLKEEMWADPDKFPAVAELTDGVHIVQSELEDELKAIRKLLKMPSLKWTSVAGEDYLIEVRKSENRPIPVEWAIESSTKNLRRYRSPQIKTKMQELAQYKESLHAEAAKAFLSFLDEIAQDHYAVLREAVNKLATADCLFSLAHVAHNEGYVRPEFTDSNVIEIVDGRHPMVEVLRSDPFVPNTVRMGEGEPTSKIITGPNMGGKSSCVRMIALIVVMAQIGSYVPAASVKLGMHDGILTRMGASDELTRGRSTFMCEMSETSDILRAATPRSLVILDELGRGTSTFDGMAIAEATLQHLVQTVKCKTLFITHYPLVATELERKFPQHLQNLHMGFTEESRIDGTRDIAFLYRLTAGMATESFGIECARLAKLPEDVLDQARIHSESMREEVEERQRRNKTHKLLRTIMRNVRNSADADRGRSLWELRQVAVDI